MGNIRHLREVKPAPPMRSVRGIRLRRLGRELNAIAAIALAGAFVLSAVILLIGGGASGGVLGLVLWGFILHRAYRLVEGAITRWTDRPDLIIEHRNREVDE